MSLIKDLLERPFDQAITSKYTAMNGLIYLGAETLVLIWPGMVQTIFRDASFVGNEAALIRVMGMTVMVIGWLYLFGGLSGGRRIVAASVLDRVVLVPLVLVPLAIAGVFLIFCWRLRFSTRRSAFVVGCSGVDRTVLDFALPQFDLPRSPPPITFQRRSFPRLGDCSWRAVG